MVERIPIAFLAGVVSVVTPCVLPLVPGYLTAVSSIEAERLSEKGVARRIAVASIPFMIGFTVVFVALGAGSAAIASSSSTVLRGSVLLFAYSLGIGAAFLLAGIAFARSMGAFRWVRDHYSVIRILSGVTLITLGLLLFFGKDWWLHVMLNRALAAVGLGQV